MPPEWWCPFNKGVSKGEVPLITYCLLAYFWNRLNKDFSYIKWISSNVLLALLFVNVLISLNLYAVHSSYKLS